MFLLASGASLPSRTAGAGFPYMCMYPTMHFGPTLLANVTGLASSTRHNAQHSTSINVYTNVLLVLLPAGYGISTKLWDVPFGTLLITKGQN